MPAAYCSECGAVASPERRRNGPQVIHHRLACRGAERVVEANGNVRQEGPFGLRLVGRVVGQPSGRWHVIMLGRTVAMRLRKRETAVELALTWQPEDATDAETLALIVNPALQAPANA